MKIHGMFLQGQVSEWGGEHAVKKTFVYIRDQLSVSQCPHHARHQGAGVDMTDHLCLHGACEGVLHETDMKQMTPRSKLLSVAGALSPWDGETDPLQGSRGVTKSRT